MATIGKDNPSINGFIDVRIGRNVHNQEFTRIRVSTKTARLADVQLVAEAAIFDPIHNNNDREAYLGSLKGRVATFKKSMHKTVDYQRGTSTGENVDEIYVGRKRAAHNGGAKALTQYNGRVYRILSPDAAGALDQKGMTAHVKTKAYWSAIKNIFVALFKRRSFTLCKHAWRHFQVVRKHETFEGYQNALAALVSASQNRAKNLDRYHKAMETFACREAELFATPEIYFEIFGENHADDPSNKGKMGKFLAAALKSDAYRVNAADSRLLPNPNISVIMEVQKLYRTVTDNGTYAFTQPVDAIQEVDRQRQEAFDRTQKSHSEYRPPSRGTYVAPHDDPSAPSSPYVKTCGKHSLANEGNNW